ncbi:unnamed protein product, partial [Polarella glacialis]
SSAVSSSPSKSPTVRVAGQDVKVWNDDLFQKVRALHGVPDNFLDNNDPAQAAIDLHRPRPESVNGKGGGAQFSTRDGQFIVKAVSADDQKTLLQLTGELVERLLRGQTLLCPIYLHFVDPHTEQCYIAMANLTQAGNWSAKYDLKGCADDKTLEEDGKMIVPVRRRFWRADMWCRCAWTPPRWRYWQGKERARALKLRLAGPQRDEAVRLIASDAEWLSEQGIMDYSLMLGVRRLSASAAAACGVEAAAGVVHSVGSSAVAAGRRFAMVDQSTGELLLVTMGVIDFLQPWTLPKKAAQCIKGLEFNKATIPPPLYGARFARHFKERLQSEESFQAQSDDVAMKADLWCIEHC